MDAASLLATANGLRDHVLAAFTAAAVEPPARQVVQVGPPAYDCEQLTVHLARVYPGGPGQQATVPQPCVTRRTAELTVTVLRCVPTVTDAGDAPQADTVTAAHAPILTDFAIVAGAGESYANPVEGYQVAVGSTAAVPEQGGLAGVALTLQVEVA